MTEQPSPFYAYGQFLAEFQRGMVAALNEMARGFQDALCAPRERFVLTSTPRDGEAHSEHIYRLRIERERRLGLEYVHNEAQRVRRELGLPTERRR
jgi:hypothetical protein